MSQFQGWFLLVMGIGLVAVAVQGIFRGWLPNGPNGFRQGKGVSREGAPLGFWFFFSLYCGGGLYIAAYALKLLTGHAESLPLQ
jgi:hypothetical protein